VFNDYMNTNNKRAREDGVTSFNYPKHHTGLKMYSEKIRYHGTPDGFTTEHMESKHKDVKDAYRKGNKKSDFVLRVTYTNLCVCKASYET
jgi:hypothetical protein